MKKRSVKIIISIITVLVIVLAVVFVIRRNDKELKFNTAVVEEKTIEVTVMATGYIQPVEDVEVGTQVSGVIEKLYVDYNSVVKKGQLLAELDKSTLQEKLNQANASLLSAESDLNYARQNFNRVKQLHEAKAATDVELEDATNKLTQAQTSVANITANLNQAKVNLSYAYIYSPIDGVVLNRSVNTGQTVAASFNTPTLFTIAEDLTKMQVEADVDEADIGHVRLGQRVTFTVDAFNDDVFTGTVSQIRLQPTVTNNVVTYTVIVEAPNPEEKLYPGMTANITIVVQSESGIAVPVEATNFRMTDEIAKKLDMPAPPAEGPRSRGPESQRRPQGLEAQHVRGSETQSVWVKNGNEIHPRPIETGISDGINMIVKSGLTAGEEVVLSAEITQKSKNKGKAVANPLIPQRPGGRGGQGGGPR